VRPVVIIQAKDGEIRRMMTAALSPRFNVVNYDASSILATYAASHPIGNQDLRKDRKRNRRPFFRQEVLR
jgi:hypothetical protein